MDLHVYRNSQDRWYDLRSTARLRGAVLAVNAVTLDELAERLTPDVKTATPGQRLAVLGTTPALRASPPNLGGELWFPNITRYAYDAISELKAARIRPPELRSAAAPFLADILDHYNDALRRAELYDPHDRRVLAASRVKESENAWLRRFERVVLHALYDLSEAEFLLIRTVIEVLPEGGMVMLFNTTANVKPTQFAEWTWQRFVQDESLAEKTFPEFCRTSRASRAVLDRLFVFGLQDPLPPDDSLRIVQAFGRYNEVQIIGGEIADLLTRGESPNEIAVVVRHIDMYGEMIEDVFTRYGIPHAFETGVPLLRIPFIKYWLAVLDLASSERPRGALARVMSSAYFAPRISPNIDVERELVSFGYIDRRHLRASALAVRKNSPLTTELKRFEEFLDSLEHSTDSILGFLSRLQPPTWLTQRDRHAWRVLVEELESIDPLPLGEGGRANSAPGEGHSFADFRQLVSEICGLRTADRFISMPLPPGLPRVRIISPHSLGYREYKWIFAPGFADGEFPSRPAPNPLLPDEVIEAINARIRPPRLMNSRDRGRREPLYLFMILDSALNRVTMTYPGSTLEGNTIYPSTYVREIERHYQDSPLTRPSPSVEASPCRARALRPLPRGEGEWLSTVTIEWRRGLITDERARLLLGDDIIERAKFESMGTARANVHGNGLPPDHIWHPSELNTLTACPFVFLARHALRLRSREVPDFEVPAMEMGILVHAILRDFYSEPVPAAADAARTRMSEIIARRLSSADISGQGPYSVFDPSLWKIRRTQVVSVLTEYVHFAVRDALDGFETQVQYLDSPLPAAQLGQAVLAGRPDHVAVHRTGGRIDAIRVDDFKYSAASSSTSRLLKDSFQIPIYLYLAAQALAASETVRMEGRYLLLRSPGNPVMSCSIDSAVFDDVRNRIDTLVSKAGGGRFRPDPLDKQVCMECEYRRLCRLYGT
jgi:hypothetical protein